MDVTSTLIIHNYAAALVQLAMAEALLGRANDARAALDLLELRIPPDRGGPTPEEFAKTREAVEAALAQGAAR
jgi:hypothetical protein